VREDHLRECHTRCVLAEKPGETERLEDRQVGLDLDDRVVVVGLLVDDLTTTLRERVVHTADALLGDLDVADEHGLHETGARRDLAAKDGALHGRHDLTRTTVDRVGVEHNVVDLNEHTPHGLATEDTRAAGLLEGGLARVLDLVEVRDTLGHVDEDVAVALLDTEAPDLSRGSEVELGLAIGGLFLRLVDDRARTDLHLLVLRDLAVLDELDERLRHGHSRDVEAVVLVGRLADDVLLGLLGDGLAEGHDGFALLDGCALHVLLPGP